MILYEFPFNERIRTYLRLEHLFSRFGQLVPRSEPVDHHFALTTLFEIMDVASRSELKSDVLKDLDRQKQLYNSYRGNPAISEQALDQVIAQLDAHFETINEQVGKLSTPVQDGEFLSALRSRSSIPGGTCELTFRATTPGSTPRPSAAAKTCCAGAPALCPCRKPFTA